MAARLTLIVQDFLPGEGTGIGRYCDNLLREFRARGLRFNVRSLSTRDFRVGPIHFGYYQRIAYQRAFVRPSGVVHTMYLLAIPPTTRIATVWDTFYMRGPPSPHIGARWVHEGVKRDLMRRPLLYVAITEAVRKELHRHLNLPFDRIFVAQPGVEIDRLRPKNGPRPAAMPEDGKVNVLHVGLGYERKGVHRLVDALAELGPEKFRLVRVGPARNPTYVRAYQSRASAVGLELVECGFVPNDALPAYYGYADLFVFPSADEGAGIPPLEAMACGTNVVVSDLPAHREMCGDLAFYASSEPGGLAAAIAKALDGRRPADVLRGHAAKFTWSKTAETYLRLYSEVGAA